MSKTKEMLETKDYLKELGFNILSMGFNYWILAIDLYERNSNQFGIIKMENIYNEIAEIYHTTRSNVERCMRTARIPATDNMINKFNYNGKITNMSCLKLLTMYLESEE